VEPLCPPLAGQRIRWIVPHAVGGGYDGESRALAPALEQALGAAVAVDNMPGAGGLVGARAIAQARPDGRTLGIIGMPGLLVAEAVGLEHAPAPRDFALLGRVARSWHVWAVRGEARIRSFDDLLALAKTRPIVAATTEVTSVNFVSLTVSAASLGVPLRLVGGFEGTQASALAVLRGDVDVVCFNIEAMRALVVSRELRPILQVSDRPIAGVPALQAAPVLLGAGGLGARLGVPADRLELASALVDVMGAGRLAVAPAALPSDLVGCLDRALQRATSQAGESPDRPSSDVAAADRAKDDVARAAARVAVLARVVRDAVKTLQ
jgi:hypothetical protein